MWNAHAKLGRLESALRFRRVDPGRMTAEQLIGCLAKRTTDRQLNNLVGDMLGILEPPGCEMSHCEHYGNTTSFCNCRKEFVPGNCGRLRAYRKRKKAREAKRSSTNGIQHE